VVYSKKNAKVKERNDNVLFVDAMTASSRLARLIHGWLSDSKQGRLRGAGFQAGLGAGAERIGGVETLGISASSALLMQSCTW
jgi:hypothetical protein